MKKSIVRRHPDAGRRPSEGGIQTTNHKKPITKSGFTLIELMMVVGIIAILLAILVPAVQSAISNARNREVASEITGLETAVAAFKAQYGVNPPSSITLYEQGGAWSPESRKIIRRIFGLGFDFSKDRDINGNGTPGEATPIELTGDECLVFFLGGVPDNSGAAPTVLGFSHSKTDPFSRGGSNRIKAFGDFAADRLIDTDMDGMPSYFDKFNAQGGNPIIFFSKMKTGIYDENDCLDPMMNLRITNVYNQGTTSNAWKEIQIISPGRDGQYGAGGAWSDASGLATGDTAGQDNITNFSGGVLER